jgi:hypothetical protein
MSEASNDVERVIREPSFESRDHFLIVGLIVLVDIFRIFRGQQAPKHVYQVSPRKHVYQVSPRKLERGTTTGDGQRCEGTKGSEKLRLATVSDGRSGLRRPSLYPAELRARMTGTPSLSEV